MNLTEKNKMLDKISIIVIMAIFVEFFLYAVDYCFTTRFDLMTNMPTILNIVGVVFLLISIFLFIKSNKNEKDKSKFIYAIEFLILAFLCPFMTYWYYPKYFGLTTNFIHSISHHSIMFVVLFYYVARIVYVLYKSYKKSDSNRFKKLNKKKAKN